MEVFLYALIRITEMVAAINLGYAFLPAKEKRKLPAYILTVLWGSLRLSSIFPFESVRYQLILNLLFALIVAVAYLYLLDGQLAVKLALAPVAVVMIYRVDLFFYMIAAGYLGYSYYQLFSLGDKWYVMQLMQKVFALCLSAIIRSIFTSKRRQLTLNYRYCLVIGLFTLFCLQVLMVMFNILNTYSTNARLIRFMAASTFVANILLLFLMGRLEEERIVRQDNLILQQQIEAQMSSVDALKELYAEQRKLTHDFNNHLIAIKAIAGDNKQVADYADRLIRDNTDKINVVSSNNIIVDTLVNQKLSGARARGISMGFEINDLSDMAVPDRDMVVILANALDNAIEAARSTERKYVKLKILNDEYSTLVSVINSSGPVDIGSEGIVKTSKADSDHHGYGMRNIKNTADKYGGIMATDYHDGLFQLTVIVNK